MNCDDAQIWQWLPCWKLSPLSFLRSSRSRSIGLYASMMSFISLHNHLHHSTSRNMSSEHQHEQAAHYAEALRERFETKGMLAELQPYPNFVVWRYSLIDGQRKKPPFNPKTHEAASPTDPRSWGTLETALTAVASGRYQGIGFMLSQSPFTGIDLDHCIEGGTLQPWAQAIIEALDTYTEYSPSWNKATGTGGVHLLVAGKPPGSKKAGNIEVYGEKHYLTITTNHMPETPATINSRQTELDALYTSLAGAHSPTLGNTGGGGATLWTPRPVTHEPGIPEKADEQVIQDSLKEERSNFARYWNGDPSLWTPPAPGVKSERKSPSEAFFVLLLMLLTRTGDNTEQVKRLYRHSPFAALYPKAEAVIGHDKETGELVTYLESSIRRAIEK